MSATVRDARSSDAEAIARVHIASTLEAYAPLAEQWPAPDLEASTAKWQSWLRDTDARRVDLLLELDGSVIGFISGGSARLMHLGAEVEIRVIHVLPEQRGHGFGDRLWSAAMPRLRGESQPAMYVSTLAELRCCSFYAAHGGEVLRRSPRAFHGSERIELIYFWPQGRSAELRASRFSA